MTILQLFTCNMHSVYMQLKRNVSVLCQFIVLAIVRRNRSTMMSLSISVLSFLPKWQQRTREPFSNDQCLHWFPINRRHIILSLTLGVPNQHVGYIVSISSSKVHHISAWWSYQCTAYTPLHVLIERVTDYLLRKENSFSDLFAVYSRWNRQSGMVFQYSGFVVFTYEGTG